MGSCCGKTPPRRALVLVDVQNDFCPKQTGSLAVPEGDDIVEGINRLRERVKFDVVTLTQDWHPPNHCSFASNNGRQPFEQIDMDNGVFKGKQTMWPDHCIQGSKGAEFHPDLKVLDTDIVVQKGTNPLVDSYSGFFDNARLEKTKLDSVLKEHKIDETYICGLALDVCVSFTVQDSCSLGYKTFFLSDISRGLGADSNQAETSNMAKAGAKIVRSDEVK